MIIRLDEQGQPYFNRWRFRLPTKAGPWRATKEEAEGDAIDNGCGHREAPGALCYLHPFAWIEPGDGPVRAAPRRPKLPPDPRRSNRRRAWRT